MDDARTQRTLTVCSRWGLLNRLRVLLSGLALAEASGRTFTMLWPRHYNCAAMFQELFTNDLHVIEGDLPRETPIYGLYVGGPRWPDFLCSDEQHLAVLSGAWLTRPELYPHHAQFPKRCAELLDALQPVAYVADCVRDFRSAHFRPTMIGVHLRRGDFAEAETRENTQQALAQVDVFLANKPDAGILLCTDDGAVQPETGLPTRLEGVKDVFRSAYGERVVWTEPQSLDRRSPEAIQDALVDFLLLRATGAVVGTKRSSFSRMAVFGREVPSVMCGSSGAAYDRRRLLTVITGVYPVVKLLGFIEYRRNVPFSQLARHYRRRLLNQWARLRSLLGRSALRRG